MKNNCPGMKEPLRITKIKIKQEGEELLNEVVAVKTKIGQQLKEMTVKADEAVDSIGNVMDKQLTLSSILRKELKACIETLVKSLSAHPEIRNRPELPSTFEIINNLDVQLRKVAHQLEKMDKGFRDLYVDFFILLRKSEDLQTIFMNKISELDDSREIREIFSAPGERESGGSNSLYWGLPQK